MNIKSWFQLKKEEKEDLREEEQEVEGQEAALARGSRSWVEKWSMSTLSSL